MSSNIVKSQITDVGLWEIQRPTNPDLIRNQVRQREQYMLRNIQLGERLVEETQMSAMIFLQYFENLAELNSWGPEKSRRVLLSTLRWQAKTFAYGMPLVIQRDYGRLKKKMEERFGHTVMKEKYIAETQLRKNSLESPCVSLARLWKTYIGGPAQKTQT